MSTPLPSRTAANDRLIASTPFEQLTDRQKQYAALYGVKLQAPSAPATAPAPTTTPTAPVPSPAPAKGGWMSPSTGAGVVAVPSQAGVDPDKAIAERNAQIIMEGLLREWGLESLAPVLLGYIKQGYSPDAITMLLQQTPEYKQRFSGNEGRRKNGLAPLSPAEYLSAEAAYRQALSSAGLPASYFDNRDDFAKLIADDKSPAEIKRRADKAMQFVQDADPAYIKAFQDYYGAGIGDIAAYFLDGAKNEALLDKRAAAATIGAAASSQGLHVGRDRAEVFADRGMSEAQARQGYGNVAQVLPGEKAIAERFGEQYDQNEAEDEFLGGLASARRKRERLNQQEGALFEGSSAVGQGSLRRAAGGTY